jgi:hypothetical protein
MGIFLRNKELDWLGAHRLNFRFLKPIIYVQLLNDITHTHTQYLYVSMYLVGLSFQNSEA